MAILTGGSFKEISPENIRVRSTTLNQLIDVIQEDVSGSATRKAYQVFVTGGIGPGVTSSLYQTVYDQDFTLQTANPIFDITIGINASSQLALSSSVGEDGSSGKMLFSSQSVMMREKVDIYKQFATNLLGSADKVFGLPYGNASSSGNINAALFLSFKRLFARDQIKRETFAIRLYRSASSSGNGGRHPPNLNKTSTSGSAIFTDIGAASSQETTFGGEVGNIVNSANIDETVGLIFYDTGTIVLNAETVFSGSQKMSGSISACSNAASAVAGSFHGAMAAGTTVIGSKAGNINAKLVPDLWVSASIDDIIDHVSSTRFSSGSLTSITFQNVTNINSTLIFCRASADEFNYSANPTFKDENGKISVIDIGSEGTQRSFTFPTTVGLHDDLGRLLAVAKMSRPIEKNDEKDITFRVRLDF